MSERAALYLRVSTDDGKQTEENQRRELREFVEDEGYELAGEYVDHESGRKGGNEREAFDRMFEAAEGREFDTLVFWSLDRCLPSFRERRRESGTSGIYETEFPFPRD